MAHTLSIRLPRSRLVRDVMTTYAGFLANAVFSFATLTLMAKRLGPENFGLATLANQFMAIISGVSELGIGIALVRLASQAGVRDDERGSEETDQPVNGESQRSLDSGRLMVAAVWLKLLLVVVVCGLAYLGLPWYTRSFLHRPEMTALLRWCLVGAVPLSLAMFAGALFQIRGAFRDNAATIGVAGAVRAAAVALLWWSGHLNLQTAVAAMILMNVVQCGMCLRALRPVLPTLPWRSRIGPHIQQLLGYTKHLVIWLLIGTVLPRADLLLLTYYVREDRIVGYYAAAAQLCLVVQMLTGAINLVLLPRISALRSTQEMLQALRGCRRTALAVISLVAPAAAMAGWTVYLIFGHHYVPTIPLFRVLLIAAGIDMALNPLCNFWHALNRPGMLSVQNVVRLSLLVTTASLLIPRLGSMGAAIAMLVSTTVALSGQGVILWVMVRRQAADAGTRVAMDAVAIAGTYERGV